MKIKALSNIQHDGILHQADYVLEVSDDQAKQLIDSEVAVKATDRDIKVSNALRDADADEAANSTPRASEPKTVARPDQSWSRAKLEAELKKLNPQVDVSKFKNKGEVLGAVLSAKGLSEDDEEVSDDTSTDTAGSGTDTNTEAGDGPDDGDV